MICHPVPQEGRWPSSRTLGRGAVDAAVPARIGWSQGGFYRSVSDRSASADERCCCVRQNRVVLTPQRLASSLAEVLRARPGGQNLNPRGDGVKQARSPGRARYRPLKPLRRESRIASAGPVCSCACFCTILHTRPRVQRASGFPCALFLQRVRKFPANLGRNAPRDREGVSIDTSLRAKRSNAFHRAK